MQMTYFSQAQMDQTKLDHKIERYTSSTGELIAWVKIPTLDYDDDTTIYMYYGNASASSQQNVSDTWNSNYIAVWQLNEIVTDESTAGTHADSTSSGENGTRNNNDDIAGKIATAQDFDNTADYINNGDDADLDFTNSADFSFTTWVNLDATGNSEMIMAKKMVPAGLHIDLTWLTIKLINTTTNKRYKCHRSNMDSCRLCL
ncbi:MAG: hypothetical protein KatS3mg087_0811 [Patescibacteria group bacterium]|nr:MAG: hypothetical protein KatS3mg087_0811 [Patescibacteria group bacterium]